MASIAFPDINFYQDTENNRTIISDHPLYGYNPAGGQEPNNELAAFDYADDSGTTPGVLYASAPSGSKNIVNNSKILMRVKCIPTTNTDDGAQYLAPLVKNFRSGDVITQSTSTKTASGNNKLGYYRSNNPAGNVDTLITPKPALVSFTIKKLTFGAPDGGIFEVFNEASGLYETLPEPRPVTPDQYFVAFLYDSFVEFDTDARPSIPAPSVNFSWPGDPFPSTDPYDLYVWFELTPTTPFVDNVRVRIDWNDTLEYVTLGANNCPIAS
jgi:hypothetical protein